MPPSQQNGLLRVERQEIAGDHMTTVSFRPPAAAFTAKLYIFDPTVFPENPAAIRAFHAELSKAQEWAACRKHLDHPCLAAAELALRCLARYLGVHPSKFSVSGPEPVDNPKAHWVPLGVPDKQLA